MPTMHRHPANGFSHDAAVEHAPDTGITDKPRRERIGRVFAGLIPSRIALRSAWHPPCRRHPGGWPTIARYPTALKAIDGLSAHRGAASSAGGLKNTLRDTLDAGACNSRDSWMTEWGFIIQNDRLLELASDFPLARVKGGGGVK